MGVDGMQAPSPGNVPVGEPRNRTDELRIPVVLLRILTMILILISLLLMVTDKQTKRIPVNLPGMSNTIYLEKTATFSQIKGVQFFVWALSVALAYLFMQTIAGFFTILMSGTIVGSKSRAWATFILDQLVAYLLVSAAAAVAEIGYIAKHGETKVGWNQVCTDFKHFCLVYGFSLVNAFLSVLAFAPVVAMSAFHLFRMHGTAPYAK